jgi:hypothetical protein
MSDAEKRECHLRPTTKHPPHRGALLEALGHVVHDRSESGKLAGLVPQRHDCELNRDLSAPLFR